MKLINLKLNGNQFIDILTLFRFFIFFILNNKANSTSSDKDSDKFLHKTKRNSKIGCKQIEIERNYTI